MEVPLGDTYYFKFTTRSFSTGAPTTLSGTPVISVYEENNLTQITSGITLTADYDSVTGLNDVAIVATTGNGYEVGKYYDAVITTGTVGGVSVVGEAVAHFRMMPAEDAGAGVKDVNVSAISDDSTAADNLELACDNYSATRGLSGTALPAAAADAAGGIPISDAGGLDMDSIKTDTAAILVDTGTSGVLLASTATSAQLVDDVWDEATSGHTTGGTFAKLLRDLEAGIVSASGAVNDVSATVNTFVTDLTESTSSHYADLTLIFIDGNLKGQAKPIQSYNGTTFTIVLDEDLTEAPANGDGFLILSNHIHPISGIVDAIGARTPSAQLGAPTTYDGLIYFIRQAVKNKLEYVKATDVMNLYEDDGTTVKLAHAMTDDATEATRGAGA